MKTYKVPVITVPHQTEPEIYTLVIQSMLFNGKMVSWEFCFDCRVTVEASNNSVGPAITRTTEVKFYPLHSFNELDRDDDNELLTPKEWAEAYHLLIAAADRYAREEFRR